MIETFPSYTMMRTVWLRETLWLQELALRVGLLADYDEKYHYKFKENSSFYCLYQYLFDHDAYRGIEAAFRVTMGDLLEEGTIANILWKMEKEKRATRKLYEQDSTLSDLAGHLALAQAHPEQVEGISLNYGEHAEMFKSFFENFPAPQFLWRIAGCDAPLLVVTFSESTTISISPLSDCDD